MSDKYLVVDRGYDLLNQTTGELVAQDQGRTWANLSYDGMVALEQIHAGVAQALANLGVEAAKMKKSKP